MALIQQLGEMRRKEQIIQYEFWQVEHFEDQEDLIEKIGPELFVEALNIGLEQIAKKRLRSNSDPKLTQGQLVALRRMRDLVALNAFTAEEALKILVDNNGFDEELARKNLFEGEEGE